MTILESPLFKHYKPIKEKAEKSIEQEVNFLTEQFIKACFTIPAKLEKEYTFLGEQINDMPYRPEISEWIKCTYRIRRPLKKGKTESFCLNPFHPFASHYGIWVPICFKEDCELHKICDDDPIQ